MELADQSGQPFNRAHVLYDIGYFHSVGGDLVAARKALESSLGLIEEWRLTYLSPFTMGFLGHACVRAGEIDRGLRLLEEACRSYDRIGLGLFRSLVEIQHAHALLCAGRVAEASPVLEAGLERARRRQERGHEAHGIYLFGEIALATDLPDPDSAANCFRAALDRANQQQMAPLAAQCHLSLAKILQQRQPELSGAHQLQAETIIETLGGSTGEVWAQPPTA